MRKSQNSTHSKIKFDNFHLHFFFLQWILNFYTWRGPGRVGMRSYPFWKMKKSQDLPRAGWIFFWHITILFHQCNDKKIIHQQFYCCRCLYLTQEFIFLCFDVFFPCPEKLHFFCKKSISSHSFWPRWLKQTPFYRELNALDPSRPFFWFSMFPVKKIQDIKKYV